MKQVAPRCGAGSCLLEQQAVVLGSYKVKSHAEATSAATIL